MRTLNATKKGPGRRPQCISNARHALKGSSPAALARLPADFSGAKLFRKAALQQLTVRHP